jgi:hypothetical protein
MESITVSVHKKGDKTDWNNCCSISLLSASYKVFIKYPPLKFKYVHRSNYCLSSMWVST